MSERFPIPVSPASHGAAGVRLPPETTLPAPKRRPTGAPHPRGPARSRRRTPVQSPRAAVGPWGFGLCEFLLNQQESWKAEARSQPPCHFSRSIRCPTRAPPPRPRWQRTGGSRKSRWRRPAFLSRVTRKKEGWTREWASQWEDGKRVTGGYFSLSAGPAPAAKALWAARRTLPALPSLPSLLCSSLPVWGGCGPRLLISSILSRLWSSLFPRVRGRPEHLPASLGWLQSPGAFSSLGP